MSNSSVFSKLGSDIINSKLNPNSMGNFNKKYHHGGNQGNQGNPNNQSNQSNHVQNQGYMNQFKNNSLNNSSQNHPKVNYNSINSILSNANPGLYAPKMSNIGNMGSMNNFNGLINQTQTQNQNLINIEKNNPQNAKGVSSKYSVPSQNSQNSQNQKDRTNLVDSVINSIIETQNKKIHAQVQVSNNTTKNDKPSVHEKSLEHDSNYLHNSSSSLNIHEQLSNLDLSMSMNKNNSLSQGVDSNTSVIVVSEEALDRHVNLWEIILDLELNAENKSTLTVSCRKLISLLSDEIIRKNLNFEIFSNTVLNKAYTKLFKIVQVMLIYFKFILIDFNFESNLKTNVKKIVNSLNEQLLGIIENFVFIKEGTSEKISRDFMDKYNKIIKTHKIKKNSGKDSINANSIYKNLEIIINNLKQFSNNFFKIGYFKPIHTICLDLFRLLDSYTILSLMQVINNNILFYILNTMNSLNEKKTAQIGVVGVTTKQLVFSPTSYLGIGIGGNSSPPYLPNVGSDQYTLVLDLDETLVHFFFVRKL